MTIIIQYMYMYICNRNVTMKMHLLSSALECSEWWWWWWWWWWWPSLGGDPESASARCTNSGINHEVNTFSYTLHHRLCNASLALVELNILPIWNYSCPAVQKKTINKLSGTFQMVFASICKCTWKYCYFLQACMGINQVNPLYS